MEPTEEQRRIVASQARGLVVEAGAGAAKTTTLGLYAGARQRTRILYLAFNKSIQLEAAARMPANVTCRTMHISDRPGHSFRSELDTQDGSTSTPCSAEVDSYASATWTMLGRRAGVMSSNSRPACS